MGEADIRYFHGAEILAEATLHDAADLVICAGCDFWLFIDLQPFFHPDGEWRVAVEGEEAGLLLKTDLRDAGFDFLSVIAADAYSLF